VLYATYHSQHGGKPDPACFLAASELLGVPPARCVFVGNDPWRDIEGASRVGMRTIRLISWTDESAAGSREADAVVRRIAAVPRRAGRLLEGERLCA
jgi:putative hydrolase of the HAD superfamily